MNISSLLFGHGARRRNVAILVYDGESWNIFIVSSEKREVLDEKTHVSARKCDSIPPKILEWIIEHETSRVRIVLPSELHNISLELPGKLDMEQTHTAIAWETAELTGANSQGVRHASCRLSAFGIEENREQIITASFPMDWLRNYKSECNAYGLEFEGVLSLQCVFLALHRGSTERMSDSMILLGQGGVFAFFPKDRRSGGVLMRNIAVDSGAFHNNDGSGSRFRNMLHRLEPDLENVSVYTARVTDVEETKEVVGRSGVEKKLEKSILKLAGGRSVNKEVKFTTVSEVFFDEFPEAGKKRLKFEDIKESFLEAVLSGKYGNIDTPCPMAVLPVGRRSKSRNADLVAIGIFCIAFLYLVGVGSYLFFKHYRLRRHYIEAKNFLTREKSLKARKVQLERQLENHQKIYAVINGGKLANRKCLEFLREVAGVIPCGVKLDFLNYSDHVVEMRGTTDSQGAFSAFCSGLDDGIKELGLKVASSSLSKGGDGKKKFKLLIQRRG